MAQHTNGSLATIKVGGREYPAVTKPNCRTCKSAHRRLIETQLVAGRPPKAILDDLPPGHGLTPRNIVDHLRREHLPLQAEAIERLRTADAADAGELLGNGADALAEAARFAQAVVGRTANALAAGQISPKVSDGLKAAAFLTDLVGDRATADPRIMYLIIDRILTITRDHVPREDFQAIVRTIRHDKEMIALDQLQRMKRSEG